MSTSRARVPSQSARRRDESPQTRRRPGYRLSELLAKKRTAASIMSKYSPLTEKEDAKEFKEPEKMDVECGVGRLRISRDMIQPVRHEHSWMYTTFVRDSDERFRLYQGDGSRCYLSARLHKGDVYISQYFCFPDEAKLPKDPRYVAVLRRQNKRQFNLYTTTCEHCDDVLGRGTCAPETPDMRRASTARPPPTDRQMLLQITHRDVYIKHAGVNARSMSLRVPAVLPGAHRVVWCPRHGRGRRDAAGRVPLSPQYVPPPGEDDALPPGGEDVVPGRQAFLGLPLTWDAEARRRAAEAAEGPLEESVGNNMPRWDAAKRTLIMQFVGRRVEESDHACGGVVHGPAAGAFVMEEERFLGC